MAYLGAYIKCGRNGRKYIKSGGIGFWLEWWCGIKQLFPISV